jgi:hypothetical protein
MRQRVSISAKEQGVSKAYSLNARLLAFCLLFAVAAWDYAADIPALRNARALFCHRPAHHTPENCCPLPVSFPAHRSAEKSCCETPAPTQDAIPSSKQRGDCNAACCMRVVAFAVPPQTTVLLLPVHRDDSHVRDVFDLKMDMRI